MPKKERKTVVGKFLQKLSGAVPGVLDIAGDLTGIEALNEASDLIRGNPKLTETEKEVYLKELELAKDFEIARLADVDSARKMQMEALKQDDLFSKRYIYYLASFWSVVGAGFIFAVLAIDIPEASTHIVDTILGFLMGTIVSTIIAYFFGSSRGSSDKQKAIEQLKRLK